MITNIITEMFLGNFSFLILIVGVAQLVLMAVNLKREKKKRKKCKHKKNMH